MNKDLINRIKKASKIQFIDTLDNSSVFKDRVIVPTNVPMINVALSGSFDGGVSCGHTAIAGPSKHFKTSFALVMAAAYLQKFEDAVLIFYDTEFGSPQSYFTEFGVDTSRVIHIPIVNVEELKTDMVNQLKEIKREDHVMIIVDSIGNIASAKEIDDAMEGKQVADMTRAKALKSLFRMITGQLSIKDIPLVTINHTYDTMEMYSKQVVSGGKGIVYSADNIWIVGRRQDKDGTELMGYDFILNVEKSRFVREGSKIPINVTWEKGIGKWSGLLELATDSGFVIKKNRGRLGNAYYIQGDEETFYEKEAVTTDAFWNKVLEQTPLKQFVEEKYKL